MTGSVTPTYEVAQREDGSFGLKCSDGRIIGTAKTEAEAQFGVDVATWMEEVRGPTVGPASVEAATAPSAAAPYRSPTPWSYRPYNHDDWGVVRDAQGWPVCQASTNALPNGTDLGLFRRSGTDPVEANARLIAAAPELLFALQNILAVRRGEGGTVYHCDEIADAAIAKATGQ